MVLAFLLSLAFADPAGTSDSLDRLEEILELRIDDGLLSSKDVLPAIVVSLEPRYEGSEDWFATRALDVLGRVFHPSGLRLCEACMAPRAYVDEGRMTYQTGPVGLDEIVRLDDQARGDSQPARTAVWIDEWAGGVSVKIIDLRTGRVVLAQNVDPYLVENQNSERMYSLAAELERRSRGEGLAQGFVDIGLFPQQHISMDWTDQWGKTNSQLSGVTLTLFDPVFGLGVVHYQRIKLFNVLIGAKGVVSLPTAVIRNFDEDAGEVIDPLLSLVGMVRVPFGRSNYGALLSISTNGRLSIGISLMNIRFLPVLP